jgi:hypothetical protein
VTDDTWRDYEQAKLSTAASLRRMIGSLDAASPMEAALAGIAGHLAGQMEQPSPFRQLSRAVESPGCYEASWGWVHSRPSCRCSR